MQSGGRSIVRSALRRNRIHECVRQMYRDVPPLYEVQPVDASDPN